MKSNPNHSRVLIVEDNDSQRETLYDILANEGFDTITCTNGKEALKLLEEERFAVSILDHRLPDMTSTDLMRRIRGQNGRIRAIIHTGYGSFDSARDAVNLGAFAYVEKMGEPQHLVRHVHRAVREEMREALRRSERRFRELVNNLDAIVWEAALPEWKFTFVGKRAESIVGYPVEQWLREPNFLSEHIHPDDRENVFALYLEAIHDGLNHECEYRVTTQRGRKNGCTMYSVPPTTLIASPRASPG